MVISLRRHIFDKSDPFNDEIVAFDLYRNVNRQIILPAARHGKGLLLFICFSFHISFFHLFSGI